MTPTPTSTPLALILLPRPQPIDPLDGIVPRPASTRVIRRQSQARSQNTKRLNRISPPTGPMINKLRHIPSPGPRSRPRSDLLNPRTGSEPGLRKLDVRAGEVLRDLDLDVAKVSLAGSASALLLGGIFGLGGPRRTAFQAAVPVV